MKKLNIILSGLVLCGMMLTGCDNEQVLPPVSFPDGGSEESLGMGTWDNPYHVWQVLSGTDNGYDDEGNARSSAWVTGYIVGYISTSSGVFSLNADTGKFTATGAEATNIIMAESPDEKDWEKCMSVQLPSGPVRNAVNLQQNPDNLGKEITLFGELGSNYMGVKGIRSVSAYEWGSEGSEGVGGGGSGSGGDNVSGGTTYLTSGFGDFTIENVTLGGNLTFVWSWDSYNYAKASAYLGGSNQNAESYLISPEIKLDDSAPAATFSQAVNYLNGNNVADFLSVCVREGKAGEWKVVNVSTWPAGTGWTFSDGCAIDLSAYAGKTVQIAFHYKSTTACSPTWEVKNLSVGKKAN